jgi:hypothetical protein
MGELEVKSVDDNFLGGLCDFRVDARQLLERGSLLAGVRGRAETYVTVPL